MKDTATNKGIINRGCVLMGGGKNNTLTRDKLFLIKELIKRNGYKFTNQRRLILEQFLFTDRHLSVEEIHERLKENNIGLATIYRNVKMFNNIGILKEIVVDGVSYYELKIYSQKPLHIHFQCIRCNDIIDIDETKIALKYLNLNKSLEDASDLEIYDANIMLIGLCKRCREVDKCQDQ